MVGLGFKMRFAFVMMTGMISGNPIYVTFTT
jgi:hypothetical protein